MARFRCPRCGAVVEGLHDRCPRCNVMFKYRKEDIDLLTPYKAPAVEQPERIEEKPAPEPLPQEPEVKEEPVVQEVKEEPVQAPVEEEKPAPIDWEKKKKAKSSSLVFGILGLVFTLLFNWNILAIIFGGIACGNAKKAKPLKAGAGKALGIIDIILGILGLLFTLAVITLLVLALVGVGGYFIYMNWDSIMALFQGSSAVALF